MSSTKRTPSSANDLTAMLLVEIPKAVPGARAWRMSVGGAYPIQSVAPLVSAVNRGDLKAARDICTRMHPRHFGAPNGSPDIDGILPDGRRLGVEVKWGKDKQSDEQKVCQTIYDARGAIYIVARDMDQAIEELKRRAGLDTGS